MSHSENRTHRRSIRLQGYDYSQPGAYFVTICAHERVCLFGDIDNGEMILNESGRLVRDEWLKIAEIPSDIQVAEFVVMQNHFHGIVVISGEVQERAIRELPLRQSDRSVGAIDGTTSHSTRPSKNDSQVAGYHESPFMNKPHTPPKPVPDPGRGGVSGIARS